MTIEDEVETAARQRIVVLLAKSAFAAAPTEEMRRLAMRMDGLPSVDQVLFAFSEQGSPSLREIVLSLRSPEVGEVVILPLLFPMEPSFQVWVNRSIQRWREGNEDDWPIVRLAPTPSLDALAALLSDTLALAIAGPSVAAPDRPLTNAALVPFQKHRVLVCQGGPCNDAGSASVWGHLRNEQERLKLRTANGGTMTAKSTCLGPCNLAPVVQVFPEGIYYGGVTETGIDRIIADHLMRDVVVEELAYRPTGAKQALRV